MQESTPSILKRITAIRRTQFYYRSFPPSHGDKQILSNAQQLSGDMTSLLSDTITILARRISARALLCSLFLPLPCVQALRPLCRVQANNTRFTGESNHSDECPPPPPVRWTLGTIERRCGVTVLVKPLPESPFRPGFRGRGF